MHRYTIAALLACLIFCLACDTTTGVPAPPPVEDRRVRRFVAPVNQPQPPRNNGGGGGGGNVDVDIHRQRGGGTVVRAEAQGNIYRSNDGNTRVDAHGHYERTHGGPNNGQRSRGGGINFSHRW